MYERCNIVFPVTLLFHWLEQGKRPKLLQELLAGASRRQMSPTFTVSVVCTTCFTTQDGREQAEIMSEAHSALEALQSRLDQWETRRLLNGSYDDR